MLTKTIKRENAVEKQIVQQLPELEKGVNLLNAGYRSHAFHVLVAKYLRTEPGNVLWADSANNSNAYIFTDRLTPRKQVYNRIKVARAFTTHKHFGLIKKIRSTTDSSTGLIAIPAMLHLYRNGDTPESEAHHLLDLAIEKIEEIKRETDAKILISSPIYDSMGRKLMRITDNPIDLEKTPEGTVFRTKSFQTQSFGNQTNLKFWENSEKQNENPTIEQVLK